MHSFLNFFEQSFRKPTRYQGWKPCSVDRAQLKAEKDGLEW